jgi:hypothetical protein
LSKSRIASFWGEVAFARTNVECTDLPSMRAICTESTKSDHSKGEAPARMVASGTQVSETRRPCHAAHPHWPAAVPVSYYWAAVAGHASTRVHCEPRHLAVPAVSDTRLDLTGRPHSLLSAVRFALAIHQESFRGTRSISGRF